MAIITEVIPDQAFLIVQNKIAEILLDEITNQNNIQSLDSEFKFYKERINPYDKSEDVSISIAFREGDYDEYSQKQVQGQYMYFIDIFAGGIESDDETLSANVANKLFKYCGIVRYILSSGKYPTLGLPLGLIGNKQIKKVTFDTDYSNWGNHSNYDGSGIRFCRIIFLVKAIESQKLWEGIPLEGNDTVFYYEQTAKGTQLKFNN